MFAFVSPTGVLVTKVYGRRENTGKVSSVLTNSLFSELMDSVQPLCMLVRVETSSLRCSATPSGCSK